MMRLIRSVVFLTIMVAAMSISAIVVTKLFDKYQTEDRNKIVLIPYKS